MASLRSLFLYVIFMVSSSTCAFSSKYAWSSKSCNLPPSVWCSSPDTIAACKVEEQCMNWRKHTELVNFTLYYESLCPDCQHYIVGEFYRAFKKVGPLINLELVPFGNAQEIETSKGWKFICQHGPRECLLNKVETCLIKKLKNSTSIITFIHGLENCLMKKYGDIKCIKTMCLKYAVNFPDLMACANGDVGIKYEHEMALKTKALNPPNKYVPWVTLNGIHTEDIQKKAEEDLVALICETYQGPDKSYWCRNETLKRCQKNTQLTN